MVMKPKHTNKEGLTAIEERFFNQNHSLCFSGMYKYKDTRLLVIVRRNHYDKQSEAAVSVWSEMQLSWNFVNSIPSQQMEVVKGSFHVTEQQLPSQMSPQSIKAFEVDINNLLTTALQVV